MENNAVKPRARSLGLPFTGTTGKFNAITDVPGVKVGFTTIVEGEGQVEVGKGPVRTGVTAVLPRGRQKQPGRVWAGRYNLNGNGEMTGLHWVDDAGYFIGPICLTNTHSIGMAHHGVVRWMIEEYGELFQQHHAWDMPVVAETYDGMTNDICGLHVTEAHVLDAIRSARSGAVAEGNVGGGTGMRTYGFKGGTGTASRMVSIGDIEYTVGVLVQANFGMRKDLTILGVPVGQLWPEDIDQTGPQAPETGSIIVIIGTDVPVRPGQLRRMAKRGALGIGRTGAPGGNYSGDIILAFSTANEIKVLGTDEPQPPLYSMEYINDHYLDQVYSAVVQATEESIVNAMIAAETMTTVKPAGKKVMAINHRRLRQIMRDYNRLAPDHCSS